jgi:predicted nuclease of restriction endonuclease-like (RecB) superfamily
VRSAKSAAPVSRARQKRIQLDGEDFYIDLLFYNRKLKRLIVVELKQGSFKPE